MSPDQLTVLTFVAAVTAIAGVYSILSDLFLRDRARVGRRVEEEFSAGGPKPDRARQARLFKDLDQIAADVEAEGARPTLAQRIEAMVEQSGLPLTPRRLLALVAAAGLAAGAVVGLLRQSPIAGALAAVPGAAAPLLYVQSRRNGRMEKLRSQLPDAFDLMGRVVRAGQTMPQAMQAVADEFPAPIGVEFTYCYEQQNLGLSPEMALRELARRTGLLEVKIFVLALSVQQQTGGNLAELLDKLATVVRERFRIRGQIRTMTAEGRIQALVLLALPLVMFVFIWAFNRDYAMILVDRPKVLAGCFVSEILGALWIRKIVNFDF